MSTADFKERHRHRELATCVHFNGTIHSACSAGIKYTDVEDKTAPGMGRVLPCLPPIRGGVCLKLCDKRQFPTLAEVEADEKRIDQGIANTLVARKAIVDQLGPFKRGHGGAGQMPCPVCKVGQLHYQRAGFNGHVSGFCSTADCVRWME